MDCPAFDDYEPGSYSYALDQCNAYLARKSADYGALATKLRLLAALFRFEEGQAVLDQIATLKKTKLPTLENLLQITEGAASLKQLEWPPALTAGPVVSQLWDAVVKDKQQREGLNAAFDAVELRWSAALSENRLADAQQALVQLKQLQPGKKVFYLAHAALTQLCSTTEDDINSRIALQLARKAVADEFDEERSLDCRVPRQIFEVQGSASNLQAIEDRPRLRKTVETIDINPPQSSLSTQLSQAETAEQLFAITSKAISTFTQTGDKDSCLHSISSLIKLGPTTRNLLISAYLAERLLLTSPHTPPAKLILVYIYMRLGLGSLALVHFKSLDVKRIQFDTLGHAIFTKISLVHYHPLPGKKPLDPLTQLKAAAQVYPSSDEQLLSREINTLYSAQTGLLIDIHALRTSLQQSITRRILILERRRIERFRPKNPKSNSNSDHNNPDTSFPLSSWLSVSDNRDFSNFPHDTERDVYGIFGTEHILLNLLLDTIWSLAHGSAPVVLLPTDQTKSAFLAACRDLTGPSPEEDKVRVLACGLYKVLTRNSGDVAGDAELKTSLSNLSPPFTESTLTEGIHSTYLYLDVLRCVLATERFAGRIGEGLSAHAERVIKELGHFAEGRREGVDKNSVKELVGGNEWGVEVDEGFCGRIVDSAREGWAGVREVGRGDGTKKLWNH
ncbi:hypothetical protein K470DRAFT_268027 [Piedraia hortae CBS 480.64]|uniref:Uncharacterized protein n=1 Tax=Piedraia hortae CBS 480.64 TaxID=1314780 RepID=A0A6A7C8N9_9PEZI|nr:hypothetical protein K470DRAFT_268027 [Piedraia hortae CBS 480.64]